MCLIQVLYRLPMWDGGLIQPCSNVTLVNATVEYCLTNEIEFWLGIVPLAMLEQLAVFAVLVVLVGLVNFFNRRTLVHYLTALHDEASRKKKTNTLATAPNDAIDPATGRLLDAPGAAAEVSATVEAEDPAAKI